MDTPVLLILGSLTEFTPLVRLCRRRGVRSVVVDQNRHTRAKALADAAYDLDVRDTLSIAGICRKEKVTAITTAYSDLLLECAVRIAEAAGLPFHLTPAQLPYYRDKAVMKGLLDELRIPNAKSAVLREGFREEELAGLRFPLVVKPLDLYGSRGLRVVHCPSEIREHFHSLSESGLPDTGTLLAEEYNPDHEFNIQTWVHRGFVHVLGICDREKTPVAAGSIPVSTRNIYPSVFTEQVMEEARQVLAAFISRTKQAEGPLSMQFFWSPERGLSVGEIAARFLGYEHELLAFACGVRVEELLLSGALKEEQRVEELLAGSRPLGICSAAVLYFHARDGILADQSAVEEVLHRPDVVFGELFYKEGDRIGNPQAMPYFARLDITGSSRAEADRVSRELLAGMSAKDADGRELLISNQLGQYPAR